jgi:hypothetical protein
MADSKWIKCYKKWILLFDLREKKTFNPFEIDKLSWNITAIIYF